MTRFSVASLVLLAAASAPADQPFSPTGPGTWPVEAAEAAGYPYDVPYGGHPPGGYERRIGRPYYWSVPGGTTPLAPTAAPAPAGGQGCGCDKGTTTPTAAVGPVGHGPYAPGYGPAYGVSSGPAGDPYTYHFGPGFYRSNEFGHYRFPYYSYRRPWYDVGHPTRVRDTNLPW